VSLVEAEFQLGRHREVLPDLHVMTVEHPLRERVHELFMIGLYRQGRQADALAHFRALRRRFLDELGTEPGARLREVHREILQGDADLAADHEPARAAERRTVARRRLRLALNGPRTGRRHQR
jgi:DNA-binding SARP family transcriptional activator